MLKLSWLFEPPDVLGIWRSSLTPDRRIRHPSVIVRAVLRPVTQQPQKAQLSHLPWRNWLARSTVRFVFWHISYREVDSSSLSGRAYLLLDRSLLLTFLYLGFGFLCGIGQPMQAQRLHSPTARCLMAAQSFCCNSTNGDGDLSLTVWLQDCQCWNCPSQAIARPYHRRL